MASGAIKIMGGENVGNVAAEASCEQVAATLYYEDENGFGIYAPEGLPTRDIIQKIKALNEKVIQGFLD